MAEHEVIQRVTVDVSKDIPAPVVYCKQADNMVRVLEVTVLDNGSDYAIPDGFTARLRGTKADETRIYLDARSMHGNIVQFVLTSKALSYPGKATCEVALSNADGETIKTCNLVLNIKKPAMDDAAVESTDEFQSLEVIKKEAAESRDAAAESAEKAADSERAAAESEKAAAEMEKTVKTNADKTAVSLQNAKAAEAAVKNDLKSVTEVKVEIAALKSAADATLEQCKGYAGAATFAFGPDADGRFSFFINTEE